MFETVLVANRGEIACRVIRTCARMGIKSVAVYSQADAGALHVRHADEAVLLGPPPAAESYLDAHRIIEAAKVSGAQAVHPGYGFLAENADFARAVMDAGLAWIGPPPAAIEAMGDKIKARNLMADAGVPVAPGTRDPVADIESAIAAAEQIGYPVMVKAAAGGGGIGMSVVGDADGLRAAVETARTRAERFFGSAAILLERYVARARHVEVQVLGMADGRIVALGERECSVQRRHQKLVEETPSPAVTPELRERMLSAARAAAAAVDYRGAGTVEMLLDAETGDFYFLEMNARLQVEHPITELVTGLDLVEQQLRIASGDKPTFDPDNPPASKGHAIEFRVYAEDPVRFMPGPGKITKWTEPKGKGIRVDSGYTRGDTVTPYYDPLLAKLCVWADDRDAALEKLGVAAEKFTVEGPKCNLPFAAELLAAEEFRSGDYDTQIVDRMRAR